jgi:hypothetical protein
MAGQLDRLLSLDLPNVTIGIIPFGEVALMPFNSFYMLDDEATVETWDGKYQERDEVYARIFTMLMDEALTGDEARRLITAAAASLRETLGTGGPDAIVALETDRIHVNDRSSHNGVPGP